MAKSTKKLAMTAGAGGGMGRIEKSAAVGGKSVGGPGAKPSPSVGKGK
jgi:hypothetical protein